MYINSMKGSRHDIYSSGTIIIVESEYIVTIVRLWIEILECAVSQTLVTSIVSWLCQQSNTEETISFTEEKSMSYDTRKKNRCEYIPVRAVASHAFAASAFNVWGMGSPNLIWWYWPVSLFFLEYFSLSKLNSLKSKSVCMLARVRQKGRGIVSRILQASCGPLVLRRPVVSGKNWKNIV